MKKETKSFLLLAIILNRITEDDTIFKIGSSSEMIGSVNWSYSLTSMIKYILGLLVLFSLLTLYILRIN